MKFIVDLLRKGVGAAIAQNLNEWFLGAPLVANGGGGSRSKEFGEQVQIGKMCASGFFCQPYGEGARRGVIGGGRVVILGYGEGKVETEKVGVNVHRKERVFDVDLDICGLAEGETQAGLVAR